MYHNEAEKGEKEFSYTKCGMADMKQEWKRKRSTGRCQVLGKNAHEKQCLEIDQLKIICAPYSLENVHGMDMPMGCHCIKGQSS